MSELRQKLYVPLVWSTSALLAGSGAALLILMLATVIGPFQFDGFAGSGTTASLGIWVPRAADGSLPLESGRRVAAWRALPRDEAALRESPHLLELETAGIHLLVLADARRASKRQLALLRAFIARGGSVVAAGSVAVRDADGSWLGYTAMSHFLDVALVEPRPSPGAAQIHTARRGPLSAAIAPDARIALRAEPGLPAIDAPDAELQWSGSAGDAPRGASRRLEIGLGRLAWLAAGPELALDEDETQRLALEAALQNAIAWARREPRLELATWPRAAPFAAILGAGSSGASATEDAAAPLSTLHRLLSAVEAARRRGGLVQFDLPAAGPAHSHSSVLRARLVKRLRRAGAWLTTAEQRQQWSATQSQIALGLRRTGPQRWLINVTNRGSETSSDLALRLWLNREVSALRIESTEVLQARPDLRRHPDSQSADILLPPIPAHSTRAYYTSYESAKEEGAKEEGASDTPRG